jgi:hypothetical protein
LGFDSYSHTLLCFFKEKEMKRLSLYILVLAAFGLLFLGACGAEEAEPTPEPTAEPTLAPDEYSRDLLGSFIALPEVVEPTEYELTQEIVDLGRMLYYETRISISQEIACNSCHLLDNYGVDGLQFSLGMTANRLAVTRPPCTTLHCTSPSSGTAVHLTLKPRLKAPSSPLAKWVCPIPNTCFLF